MITSVKYSNRIHTTHMFYTISAEESRGLRYESVRIMFQMGSGFPACPKPRKWDLAHFPYPASRFSENRPSFACRRIPSATAFCFRFYDEFMTFYLLESFSFHRCLPTAVEIISSALPPPNDDISPLCYPFTIHKDIRNKNIGASAKIFLHYTKDTRRENVAVYPNILIRIF